MTQANAQTNLEQKVKSMALRWPKGGKLLSRQNTSTDIFYEERVTADPLFAETLKKHLKAKKGNQIALSRATSVGIARLENYANGKTATVPLEVYVGIVAELNNVYDAKLATTNFKPTHVQGFYACLLMALFYDKVNTETKDAKNPLQAATNDLIERLVKADPVIKSRYENPVTRHSVECMARDRLTGRHSSLPFTLFLEYENYVISSLSTYGITRAQLREIFQEADRKISIIDGHNITANLEQSLEAKLKRVANTRGTIIQTVPIVDKNVKQYWYNNGMTPSGIDYFVGDTIEHPSWGLGTVTVSGAEEAKKLLGRPSNYRAYPELQYSIEVRFNNKPEGAFKPVGPNTVILTVKPAVP